jgi:hypothetical protein
VRYVTGGVPGVVPGAGVFAKMADKSKHGLATLTFYNLNTAFLDL